MEDLVTCGRRPELGAGVEVIMTWLFRTIVETGREIGRSKSKTLHLRSCDRFKTVCIHI